MTKIKADQFAETIKEALQATRNLTNSGMREAIDKTAKEATEATKAAAPVRTGVYKKSWTHKITANTSATYERTVYVKDPHYRRTHLLENGHRVKPSPTHSGRKSFVAARPHIMTDDEVDRILTSHLTEELEK